MERTKRIFFSDVHLSSQELYDDEIAWYKPKKHRKRFLSFITKQILRKAEGIKDVIINGDMFDNWVCPSDRVPPTYKEIFAANSEEIELLNKIPEHGISLFYSHGNHDFDVTEKQLQKALPKIKVIKNYLGAGRTRGEHGHQHTLFNRVDWLIDPALGRPIGYPITRLVTSMPSSGHSRKDILSYLDDLLEAALTPQTIFSSIIEGMAERAHVNSIIWDVDNAGKPVNMSVYKLKERYGKLAERYSLFETVRLALQERRLHDPVDRLCKDHSFNAVVFGHTHDALIDKDTFLVEDRIYVNSGTWCEGDAHFVEIDKGAKLKVSLYQVTKDGAIQKSKTKRETL